MCFDVSIPIRLICSTDGLFCLRSPAISFYRDEPHGRPRDRFRDRSRIIRIVLAAFEVGLHIARRYQPNRVTKRLKLAAPVVSRWTRFDPDQAWRQPAEVLQHFCATDAFADRNRARNINPMHLEYRLRNIETNRANFAHGRLPSTVCINATTLWHFDAAEWAPSTASKPEKLDASTCFPLCPKSGHR